MKPIHFTKETHSRTATGLIRSGLLFGLAGLLAACLASMPQPVNQQATTPSPEVLVTEWTALAQGTLIKTDGCLQLKMAYNQENYTLLWVPNLAIVEEDSLVMITYGMVSGRRREFILHIGQSVSLGGGTTDQVSADVRRTAPAHCPGPYWIVASIVN